MRTNESLWKGVLVRLGEILLIVMVPIAVTLGFGLWQTVRPMKIVSSTTPASAGLLFEDVRFTTSDGLSLAGWYVEAETETDAAVVVLHGYPADKGDLVYRTAFLARDFNLLYVDFRHFGESEGSYSTVGAFEVRDLLAAVAYLRQERGTQHIGVYGFSMGGAVALMGGAESEHIDAIVAESSYARLSMMAEELYRNFGPLARPFAQTTGFLASTLLQVDVAGTAPVDVAARIHAPVLLIHAHDDRVIPFAHAELLHAELQDGPENEFLFSATMEHGEAGTDFVTRTTTFFTRHLK